jgi:hypothetical protein
LGLAGEDRDLVSGIPRWYRTQHRPGSAAVTKVTSPALETWPSPCWFIVTKVMVGSGASAGQCPLPAGQPPGMCPSQTHAGEERRTVCTQVSSSAARRGHRATCHGTMLNVSSDPMAPAGELGTGGRGSCPLERVGTCARLSPPCEPHVTPKVTWCLCATWCLG